MDSRSPWIILDYHVQPPEMRCLRCEARQTLSMPAPTTQVVELLTGFGRAHKDCEDRGQKHERSLA